MLRSESRLVRPFPSVDDALESVGLRLHPDREFSLDSPVDLESLSDQDVYPELRLDVARDRIAQKYGTILDSIRLVVIVREKAIHRSRSIFESRLDHLPPVLPLYEHASDIQWNRVSAIATFLVLGTSLQARPGYPYQKGHWVARKEFLIRSRIQAGQFPIECWNPSDFKNAGFPEHSTYAVEILDREELFRSDGDAADAVRIRIHADVYRALLQAEDERWARGLQRLLVAEIATEILITSFGSGESPTIEPGSPIDSLLTAASERQRIPRERIEKWARERNTSKVRAVFQAYLRANDELTRVSP
ncbi:MAG: hypothetical protein RMK01_04595 [Thermomicrobium sp.]|nr:hypothetical protein [Thermomicrobium sp.]